jgi:hypothetical protein
MLRLRMCEGHSGIAWPMLCTAEVVGGVTNSQVTESTDPGGRVV